MIMLYGIQIEFICRENQGRETEEMIGIKKACMVNKDCYTRNFAAQLDIRR
jgi:hypothetical protein